MSAGVKKGRMSPPLSVNNTAVSEDKRRKSLLVFTCCIFLYSVVVNACYVRENETCL